MQSKLLYYLIITILHLNNDKIVHCTFSRKSLRLIKKLLLSICDEQSPYHILMHKINILKIENFPYNWGRRKEGKEEGGELYFKLVKQRSCGVVLVARKTWCCAGGVGGTNGGDSFFFTMKREFEIAGDVKEEGEGRRKRKRKRETRRCTWNILLLC